MNWNEISVSTTTQATEIISNIFIEIGSKGVMIEDPSDFYYQTKDELAWDYIEKEVFDYGHEDVKIIGYFSQEEDIEQKINDLKERLSKLGDIGVELGTLEISKKIIYQKNWENEWKKYFKTQKISKNIVIKPSWENYEKQADEKIIEIDPGMAFGTGTHETTKMCINAIEKYIKSEDILIDIGCGSGILSIAGAILGAKKVIAVDLDKLAVKISKENVELNNYQDIIEVRHGNLTDVITEKADIIVANIIADAIVMLSENIKDFMKEDAYFISSGIINEKADYVKENLIKNGFEIIEHNNDKEWNCIVAKVNKTDV
ncbi:ribosomal protein L11 methyltransferase [Peptoanaerobacter stomatis]|uniref:Ribosomal protein L11 methyltransferase n=1 Tax=Peptoanaerobacter stomatis TaxID=796937 RepID=J4W398_9FIRM|nr:50S ribosomal protein L11 methyltransferase [Peptoanaerobacter stomatis]EJU20606.1 ribosomal protein L11 methyltransferase [Peptoanaerobacter stomatis]NWO24991.1 50S ribosomal protein L11 methyltransferase [Peptostreptococcaceae bacterium oral taxon 081]